jgi:hypothetical protein
MKIFFILNLGKALKRSFNKNLLTQICNTITTHFSNLINRTKIQISGKMSLKSVPFRQTVRCRLV